MASGGPPETSQDRRSASSIYHSTDEMKPCVEEAEVQKNDLPNNKRPKSGPLHNRYRRYLRWRSNNNYNNCYNGPSTELSASNGEVDVSQPTTSQQVTPEGAAGSTGEPWIGRFMRFFSSRPPASSQMARGTRASSDIHNDRGAIVSGGGDGEVADEENGDEDAGAQAPLRPNPLYEPVLREDEDSDEDEVPSNVTVELQSDYEASQGEEDEHGRSTSCCLPCRRKSLRSRRGLGSSGGRFRCMLPSRRLQGQPGESWWYHDVSTRSGHTKHGRHTGDGAGNCREEAESWPVRQSTPPPLPPLPPPLRGPDFGAPNCLPGGGAPPAPVAAAGDSGAGTTGSTTASVHSQVDYQHYFIPDLQAIYACPYYWGVMDRYEAGEVLANKPSGSFLLRDSAQSNFIFSISFRGRGRTLHARIDVYRHSFSFDCCDPQVAKSPTVMGLLAKYQRREGSEPAAHAQPEAGAVGGAVEGGGGGGAVGAQAAAPEVVHPVSMYEPTLKQPVFRRQTFSLQDLSRAAICTHFTYDQVQQMSIPWNLKNYMIIYHYKHQVGVRDVSSEG